MPKVLRDPPNKNHLQSVIFSKYIKYDWTKRRCMNWLKEHGYFTDGFDETMHTFRFRQVDPDKKFEYRTLEVDEGITFIYAFKK